MLLDELKIGQSDRADPGDDGARGSAAAGGAPGAGDGDDSAAGVPVQLAAATVVTGTGVVRPWAR